MSEDGNILQFPSRAPAEVSKEKRERDPAHQVAKLLIARCQRLEVNQVRWVLADFLAYVSGRTIRERHENADAYD
jgi:hypothetical protein